MTHRLVAASPHNTGRSGHARVLKANAEVVAAAIRTIFGQPSAGDERHVCAPDEMTLMG